MAQRMTYISHEYNSGATLSAGITLKSRNWKAVPVFYHLGTQEAAQ